MPLQIIKRVRFLHVNELHERMPREKLSLTHTHTLMNVWFIKVFTTLEPDIKLFLQSLMNLMNRSSQCCCSHEHKHRKPPQHQQTEIQSVCACGVKISSCRDSGGFVFWQNLPVKAEKTAAQVKSSSSVRSEAWGMNWIMKEWKRHTDICCWDSDTAVWAFTLEEKLNCHHSPSS